MTKKKASSKKGRNMTKIRRLLRNPDLTFQDIAHEVGLSRERIRQLAKKHFGITGIDRRRLQESRRKFSMSQRLREVRAAAMKMHLSFEPEYHIRKNKNYSSRLGISKQRCRIGGMLCSLKNAWLLRGRHQTYILLPGIPDKTDFCIIRSPVGFLIVPRKDFWLKGKTLGMKRANKSGHGPQPSHKYDKYIEAWHLLEGPSGGAGNQKK